MGTTVKPIKNAHAFHASVHSLSLRAVPSEARELAKQHLHCTQVLVSPTCDLGIASSRKSLLAMTIRLPAAFHPNAISNNPTTINAAAKTRTAPNFSFSNSQPNSAPITTLDARTEPT